MPDLPDREQQRQWHQKQLEGDLAVGSDIADALLLPVQKHLHIKFPQTDETFIWDAVTEAFSNYVKRPQSFDPDKSSLLTYLKMSAEGDLINLLKKEKRRNSKIVSFDNVAFFDVAGNSNLEEQFIQKQDATNKLIQFQQQQVRDMEVVASDEIDRQFLALMDAKVRDYRPYAKILNITHLPEDEQRQTVKRHKDRLNLRRKRSRGKTDKSGKKKKDE